MPLTTTEVGRTLDEQGDEKKMKPAVVGVMLVVGRATVFAVGLAVEAPEWRAHWVERMEPGEPDAALARGKTTAKKRNETNEHEMRRLLDRQWEKLQAGDIAGAHEIYDDDCVVE